MNDLAQFLLARFREQPPVDVDARRIVVLDCQRAIAAEHKGWQRYATELRQLAAPYAAHPGFRDEWRIEDGLPRGEHDPSPDRHDG
jgi:predicted metal-dependent HD superfamily phosphohydrolase